MALQPDGKIVVAGATQKGTTGRDFAVARLNANGTLDSSFGAGGKTTADFGGNETAWAVALQPDGKIVVAGYTSKGTTGNDFAVARVNANGLYDSSFGAGGKTAADFGGDENAHAVALQPDGKIVLAGDTPKGTTGRDFAVARLLGAAPTTTTTTTPPPTTTTPKPKPPAGTQLAARIVYATVLGQGKLRTLDVRIRVSEKARAQLRLLRQDFERLQVIFTVKPGANELKAPLPRTLRKGVYGLEITLLDAKHRRKVYRATVVVPA